MLVYNVLIQLRKSTAISSLLFGTLSQIMKIKRKTLAGPVSHGGLNMLNFADVVKSLKTSWVNRYCRANDRHWCALLDSLLSKVGGTVLFQCNYDLKLLDLKNLSFVRRNESLV